VPVFALAAGGTATAKAGAGGKAIAIFAGGCFWCVERDFDAVMGVLDTTSGYAGGSLPNPSYDDVATGITGHVEAVRVTYDPSKVTYKDLLDFYWRHIDPTDGRGQFCDRGSAYKPVIFVSGEDQRREAEASKKELDVSGILKRPVAVEIKDARKFWDAEDEHQDYYKKNPFRYRYYRHGCGRDRRIAQIWGAAPGH
jgi:peptide-methionine (S)-S-oxide reductase